MRFVNRETELRRLDELVAQQRTGLIALWGRRRIGKTRLLLEWGMRHQGLYSVADLSAPPLQRRYLAEAIATRFPGFADVEYPDWRALLRTLSREAARATWRGPIILDEFPYLVESSPELPSVMQGWMDHEANEAPMLVAIAGSTQHMMQGLALDETSPLYGRAVAAFALPPMAPSALGQALALGDARRIVAAYAVWGGVPRYWELAEPFDDVVDEAVDRLVLDPMGPLHTEGDRLLFEERPPAVSLRPLLEAIGGGAHRVSEIAGRLGVAATALGRPLSRLVDLGLVVREQPFDDIERSGKRTLYRIGDPFLRLWFRVVAPHRALLAAGNRDSRLAVWNRHRAGLIAAAWEELCRRAVPALSRSDGPLARYGPLGPAARFWRGSGPEWDVVSRSLDGSTLLLGEAKWSERVVGQAELQRTGAELAARGRPALAARSQERVVHALFVPAPASGSAGEPSVTTIDAAAVVLAASG